MGPHCREELLHDNYSLYVVMSVVMYNCIVLNCAYVCVFIVNLRRFLSGIYMVIGYLI